MIRRKDSERDCVPAIRHPPNYKQGERRNKGRKEPNPLCPFAILQERRKDERNTNLCSVMLRTAQEEQLKVMRRKPGSGDSRKGCSQGQ